MRSGHIARLAAVTGAALVTAACAPPGGVAGIGTAAPTPGAESAAGAPASSVTATMPQATPTSAPPPTAVDRPKADSPVQVPPPKVSEHTYVFPVKGCSVTYESRLLVLPKTTIWAGKGCSFVSPVNGVVDEVNTKNRWKPSTDRGADREGRFVTVIGDDGVRYLGGHLDKIALGVRPGLRVRAGQVLGQVGNSGNARSTASNLYFAISWKTSPSMWWVRRGMVKPWDYLDAWLKGNPTLSPREEMLAVMKQTGAAPRCFTLCASKPQPTPTKKPTKRRSEPSQEPVQIPLNGGT
ncbi:peptidoglycan DD-metalloendopeptidase family protein [Streptosporangium sp. NPDC000563]|uniref:M23 family metallopeptidase n=1 Tax=unclassified Streptosporangium TaxID=2632669 RepID=UPI0033176818